MSEESPQDGEANVADDEVFEISDFTVVTFVEQFDLALEAIIHEWNLSGPRPRFALSKGSLLTCEWETKSTRISFGENNSLQLTYVRAVIPNDERELPSIGHVPLGSAWHQMSSSETEFVPSQNIVSMYGVSEYLVVTPLDEEHDRVVNEEQKAILLSGFSMAAHAAECEVPMFLQFGNRDRQLFFGVATSLAATSNFSASHLRAPQAQHTHLSGFLDIFKQQVNSPLSLVDGEPIRVSVVLEYSLAEDLEDLGGDIKEDDVAESLPIGSFNNMLREFRLISSWPNQMEEMVTENDSFTDLDPLEASHWSVTARFEPLPQLVISTLLRKLRDIGEEGRETSAHEELLGTTTARSGRAALAALAGPGGDIQITPASITNSTGIDLSRPYLPLSDGELEDLISTIFKSSKPRARSPGGAVSIRDSARTNSGSAVTANDEKSSLSGAKAAPVDGLATRFTVAIMRLLMSTEHRMTRAVCQLWAAFLTKLRYHWDNNLDIPTLESTTQPSLGACRLQQRLELLQCCMIARRRHHELYNDAVNSAGECFFDAEEDVSNVSEEQIASDNDNDNLSDGEPRGRLRLMSTDVFLQENPNSPMFIPVTQEQPPMTEESLEEYTRMLASLDSEKRTEAQMDVLLSDMQAFKAANPHCTFVDFLRWHSPKDVEDVDGKLIPSERMRIEDSAWLKAWAEARPIPVVHQKRIFNETKTAEELFQRLSALSVYEVVQLLLPVAYTQAARQLVAELALIDGLVDIKRLVQDVRAATRSVDDDEAYMEALKEIRKAETILARYHSLYRRLRPQRSDIMLTTSEPSNEDLQTFIVALLENALKEERLEQSTKVDSVVRFAVPIVGGPHSAIGQAVKRLMLTDCRLADFNDNQRFPLPSRKLYVLRWSTPRPGVASQKVPQRLFASLDYENEEFRLCGVFTDDAVVH